MTTDLPPTQPVQHIILNLDDDMGPNQQQQQQQQQEHHHHQENRERDNDDGTNDRESEGDLVSRLRNATIAGFMSIEKAFGSESSNDDDDDKKRLSLSPDVDLKLADGETMIAQDAFFDQGAYQ